MWLVLGTNCLHGAKHEAVEDDFRFGAKDVARLCWQALSCRQLLVNLPSREAFRLVP